MLPFHKELNMHFNRITNKYSINSINKLTNSFRYLIKSSNDKVEKMDKAGVIYKIKCNDCSTVHIGQTGRSLSKRCYEHLSRVKKVR